MSDYLTRLSARALGVADRVRPAIPPMFAFAPSTAFMPPAADADERVRHGAPGEPQIDEGFDAAPVHDTESRQALPPRSDVSSAPFLTVSDQVAATKLAESEPARLSRRERNENLVEATRPDSKTAPAVARRLESTAPGAVPAPPAVAGAARSGAKAAFPAAQTSVSSLAPHPGDGGSSRSPNRSVVRADLPLLPEGAADNARVLEPAPHDQVPLAMRAGHTQDSALPDGAHGPGAQGQFARLRALRDSTRREPAENRHSPAAPSVRISIGRIEVRAVAAPAPAAPPVSRGPVQPGMTLARYLARNREVGRE